MKPSRLALGTSMEAPTRAPSTCTDSDRARDPSESARQIAFSERLTLVIVPQHFLGTRILHNINSRDYTGDHRSWWRTTHGWVGKRGSQELWTDLDVVVRLSVVKWGGEEVRIDRLRRPAAQASRHLRLVHQRLLYSSRPPYVLCLLLYSTNTGASTLGIMLLPPAFLAAVFASLCPAPSFLLICAHIILLHHL